MARLNIPERFRAGLSRLRLLDEPSVLQIRAALEQPIPGYGPDDDVNLPGKPSDLPITALSSMPGASGRTELRQIAEAIAGLYSARAVRDIGVEEFADKVCDAMEALDSDESRLPHSERDQFRRKLLTLLDADVFAVITKAADLATEDEHVFCQARILTDLRPVFGTRIEDGPQGMVVVHLLKIDYHQGSPTHHQFHIALNADDLEALRKVLDRAEAKTRTLRKAVKSVRLFGIPKEHK